MIYCNIDDIIITNIVQLAFRPSLLQNRLSRDYPELAIQARSKKEGHIVYHSSAVCEDSNEGTDDDTDREAHSSSESMSPLKVGRHQRFNPVGTSYMSQLMIRNSVRTHPYKLSWPLTSTSINSNEFENSVPMELINFITGLVELNSTVSMTVSDRAKAISVCQDLVNLMSRNQLTSPKALALGLTVKHLTGSKELITILHRLGHCASYDSIRTYETSLAHHLISNQHRIPEFFAHGSLIVMVWDNIDFLEETKSGHGTTHHTNGILIQLDHQVPPSVPVTQSLPRGQARALRPLPDNIVPLPSHSRTNPNFLIGTTLPDPVDLLYVNVFEFVFAMIRNQEELPKPSWTGFNKLIRGNQSSPRSVINYLPVIQAPPTDVDVVNHVLQKSLEQADKFGVKCAVVVFDQAVYSKAQTVRFINPILQERILPRLGEFHTVMTFLGVIGKRYGDAGMAAIITESQCIAAGSMKGVLNGHSYNRAMRANKLLMESLYDLLLEQFLLSYDAVGAVASLSLDLARLMSTPNRSQNVNDHIPEIMQTFYKDFLLFIDERSKQSPTFRFWAGYIEMVQEMLNFVRATRESDWELHILSLRKLLPWFFCYDHTNYARYGALYYVEMTHLSAKHPEISNTFITQRGSFTYQSSHHRAFSSVACDQAIEQTVNRHSKSQGGVVGFTLTPSASQRWTATHPERAAIHEQMRSILAMDTPQFDQHGLSQISWQAEEDVRSLMKEVIRTRINPFSYEGNNLISITSGEEASPEVQADLEKARDLGEGKLQEFVEQRLTTNATDFNAPLKSNKSRTFKHLTEKSTAKKTLQCSGRLFDRLLVVSQQRQVDMRAVMCHSLGNVSWSLSSSDGGLNKTTKSALMAAVEKDLHNYPCYLKPEEIPPLDSLIVDGMAEIQSMRRASTFGELSEVLLKRLSSMATTYKCNRVDFVCDTYPKYSIKGIERQKRSAQGRQLVTIFSAAQPVPVKYSEFLAVGSNKEALVRFLHEEWSRSYLDNNIDIAIGYSTVCYLISFKVNERPQSKQIANLSTDHEEADTRMLLHTRFVMDTVGLAVLIKCQDTDVFIICLALASALPSKKLYLFTGKGNHMRYIDLSTAAASLTPDFCESLLGLHALSGCDSTSSFYGKGKRKFYHHFNEDATSHRALASLGREFKVPSNVNSNIEKFVCKLYGVDTEKINEARYIIYCSPSRVTQQSLPPTKDELYLHIARANYQAAIWRRALANEIQAPPPETCGWKIEGDELSVVWMTQCPAPPEVLKNIFCKCKTGCSSNRCNCKKSQLKCTDVCQCRDCSNKTVSESNEEGEGESDNYSDDSESEGELHIYE